ncbi:MAG: hypothetical protein OFPII_15480 [Osedax symbiont Rs1]|nr:MAG: hypothetical protein OFPII_15480 [Osedax symbiont Rs1]
MVIQPREGTSLIHEISYHCSTITGEPSTILTSTVIGSSIAIN